MKHKNISEMTRAERFLESRFDDCMITHTVVSNTSSNSHQTE